MIPLKINSTDRILIIAPHPDDECIGAGGILSLYPEICTVWVLTDGRIGQDGKNPDDVKKNRREEFELEMEYAGVSKYRFFDIEDGKLINHLNCLRNEDISDFTIILVTGERDGHADHLAAFRCVKEAVRSQKADAFLYAYEVHNPLTEPTHYLDITDVMEHKQRLISFHGSQLTVQQYDEMARNLAAFRGHQSRMSGRYLEVYEKIKLDADSSESKDELFELTEKYQKHLMFYRVLTRWLDRKIEGKSISEWLIGQGFRSVAIYGYAEIGRLLHRELSVSDNRLEVKYVLDKKKFDHVDLGIKPIPPQYCVDRPDAVIVTADFYFDEIRNELLDLGFKNIISFGKILEGM